MAIIFSYPPIGKNDVQPSDRLLLSQMTVDGNPTRSVTVNTLRQYLGAIIPTNIVTGTGTTNRLTKWKAPVGSGVIEDSSIEDTGSEINVPYKFNVNNATSNANGIVFPHPAGGASGIVNMYYNGAAAGSRFVISRAATGGAEIELESSGNVNINRQGNGNFFIGGEVTFDDYGSGTKTGVATYNLSVDASGNVIEEPISSGVPWPYQYDVGNGLLIQGENPGTTGTDNTALGVSAGLSLTTARESTFMGRNAGRRVTTGNLNTLFGFSAGQNLVGGNSNVAMGWHALDSEVDGDRSVAVGMNALRFQNSGFGGNMDNVGVGYDAGGQMQTGVRNSIVGSLAGNAITTGGRNTAIGYAALGTEDTGGYSTAVGSRALNDQQGSGAPEVYNTAIGADAGAIVTTGVENTIVGALAGDSLTTGSNNIIIGYDAEASAAGVDNEITIGSINHDTLRMPGLSTGATDGQVMTYESATDQIRLKDASTGVGSTTDYTTTNGYRIRIYLENITPGSPDFGQAFPAMQQIIFKRQNAAAGTQGGLPFNLFYNQYTPALDPGYDAGFGCGTANMCMLPMMEESTADVNTLNSGGSVLGSAFTIFTTDVAALNSYRLPLRMRVDNGGASPGNGTLRMTLIDGSQSAPSAADATALPSTVSVYFRDTTLTSSTVAGPPFNLLWAGKDTQFAIQQNGGAAYTNSLDYVFTGNGAGDIPRKYELFFQDEYNAYNRCSYLKVTDGRVVFEDLPTADPVSKGVLWNDAGTLKISLG